MPSQHLRARWTSRKFRAEATFGAGETLLSIHLDRSGATRLEVVGKINSNFVFPKCTTYGSCIFFSNAARHTRLVGFFRLVCNQVRQRALRSLAPSECGSSYAC